MEQARLIHNVALRLARSATWLCYNRVCAYTRQSKYRKLKYITRALEDSAICIIATCACRLEW